MKRVSLLLFALAAPLAWICAGFSGPGLSRLHAGGEPAAAGVQSPHAIAPRGDKKAPDVSFLFTVNNLGYTDTCGCPKKTIKLGSLARRITYVQQVRGSGPTLLVDGGDAFFPTPAIKSPTPAQESTAMRTGRKILTAYNQMDYQVIGLGPADLQFGVTKLVDFLREAKFQVVCANVVHKDSGKPVFAPHVVLDVGGVRFGVFSVVLTSLNRVFRQRVLGNEFELTDAAAAAKQAVAELKDRCDVIVALSHLNKDDNVALVESLPEIDILVDPYSVSGAKSIWVTEGEYFLAKGKTMIARIDGQGSRVGLLELTIDPATRKLVSSSGQEIGLEPHIFPHPEIARLIAGAGPAPKSAAGKAAAAPVSGDGVTKVAFGSESVRLLEDSFLGQETCGGCHQEQHDFWRSTKHSTAYATLVKSQVELDRNCVECHTTGYGVAYVDPRSVGNFKDVQCESCHGVKPDHAESPRAHRFGAVSADRCWGCHNPQITQRSFDFEQVLSLASCPKSTTEK